MITKKTFQYLKELAQNNSKEWMSENRDWYLQSKMEIVAFADNLIALMNEIDDLEHTTGKNCLFRINRDIRFSKDKSLYKTHFSGRLKRASEALRGGYYFHIEPGNSFLAGGFFKPEPEDLLHIRKQLELLGDELQKISSKNEFKKLFGEIAGEKVLTAPRGFTKEQENINLIRYKQFILQHPLPDSVVKSSNFDHYTAEVYLAMRPFLNFMTDILTTDLNGVRKV